MTMPDLQASPRLDEKKRDDTSVDGEFEHVENASAASASPIDDKGDNELLGEKRAAAERRLVRKLDARLLPTIVLVFILNYIDRTAVTSARLKGLEQDLGLSDIQYNTILAILYASYCPAQIPSNMILNRITRPSLYIGCCVVIWGLTSTLTGVTTSFVGILLCRTFIGLPEAAFYPGAIYLLSRWYTRRELAFRSAILYGGLLISNAFGSLMAAGILGNMEGALGIRAWRWLFYIEGAITMFVGFLTMYLLPDYPHNTRWLSPAERRLAQVRLSEDAGEADEDTSTDTAWSGFVLAMKDPKVPIMAVMTCAQLLGLSFVNFFPTLTSTLGFSTTISLLLAAPPWILSTIVTVLSAWHADRTGERYFHIAVPWWGVILGYIIGLTTMVTGGRYVAMFLMACGYAGFALTAVWVSNAIPRPPAKRAAAIAIVNGFGNIGNLIGSFTWKAEWGPDYHPSMWISLGSLLLSTVLGLVIRYMLIAENHQLERAEMADSSTRERIEDAARLEGITLQEALERKKGFRYLY
ncbi:MFS general substrate transporter [Peniophora sp. CONT]|nr:MFS general substrate transporter [Peniophora sp. CONT]